jgi:elongation factor P
MARALAPKYVQAAATVGATGRQLVTPRFLPTLMISRCFSKERAGKGIRPGVAIIVDDAPHRVSKIIQGKRGKGGGFIRATMKNLISGQTFEKTYTSDEVVEFADLEKETATYSWEDSDNYMFMSSQTFEEIPVPKSEVDNGSFLLGGLEVKLLKFRDGVIGVELPIVQEYTVVSIDGAGQSGDVHPATLDSGAVVMVPLFVGEGTKIRVNTAEGTYVERAVA